MNVNGSGRSELDTKLRLAGSVEHVPAAAVVVGELDVVVGGVVVGGVVVGVVVGGVVTGGGVVVAVPGRHW